MRKKVRGLNLTSSKVLGYGFLINKIIKNMQNVFSITQNFWGSHNSDLARNVASKIYMRANAAASK